VEATEEALETSFQAFEIVNTAYIEPFQITPYLSNTSLMMVKWMMREGYKSGKGLGKDGKGSVIPLQLAENKNRYGLGYRPTRADWKREMEEKRERSLARMEGREPKTGKITLCDIRQSFRSVGWINTDQVAAIEKELEEEGLVLVHPCSPGARLSNWESVDIPVVFNIDKMQYFVTSYAL